MKTTQFYPLIQTDDVEGTATFFITHFGFRAIFASDWYYHLQSRTSPSVNLAVLEAGHESVPEGARGVTRNVILSFELEEVDSEAARLEAQGVEVAQPLRDEPQGQRHVIFRGPNGILIDVIKPIPPSEEFLAGYTP
ncbi:MAG: VOC family protein [Pseudomonadota bacterium]